MSSREWSWSAPGRTYSRSRRVHRDPTEADEGGSAENFGANAAAAAGHSEKATRSAETLGELGDYELLEVVGRGGQGVVSGRIKRVSIAQSRSK